MQNVLTALVILAFVSLVICTVVFGNKGVNSDINSTHNTTNKVITKPSNSIMGYP